YRRLPPSPLAPAADRRRAHGDATRRDILHAAVRTASRFGLEALTIGRLAKDLGMSKGGLFAHFGSKEALQLATLDEAFATFEQLVVEPARQVEPGLLRFWALVEGYLQYVHGDALPGGCIFLTV